MSNADDVTHLAISADDLAELVRSAGGPDVRDIDAKELEEVCGPLMDSDEFLRPSEPPVMPQPMRTRVPGTGLDINIRRALLVSAAVIVDALHTAGLAMGALAALGVNMRCWISLSKADGELCNRISLEVLRPVGFPMTARDVLDATAWKTCRHPTFPCIHRRKFCTIKEPDINANFRRMAAIDTVLLGKDGSVISIQ
jgi:hypothetical protein